MKITKFEFQFGIHSRREVRFGDHFNLVFSDENTKGKTTLLRMVLYALGFAIPDMRGITFADLNFCIDGIDCDGKRFSFERTICEDGYKCHFITSQSDDVFIAQKNERAPLHNFLFERLNESVLNNILGVFYIDQEKGWNLLNRGKVIGSNRFVVEELLCGLNNIDISAIKQSIANIEKEILQYRKLFSFASFVQDVNQENNKYDKWNANQYTTHQSAVLDIKIKNISSELEQLKELRKDNSTLLDMIEGLNLIVRSSNGEDIYVTKDNLVGFKQNLAYLLMRIDILKHKLAALNSERSSLIKSIAKNTCNDDDLLNVYRNKVLGLDLNQHLIYEAITSLSKKNSELRAELRELANNKWSHLASCYAIEYLNKLNSFHNYKHSSNAILTSDLSPYSGAELSKRVLAFRFALLRCIKDALGIALPIIIDSPYSKEIDGQNFRRMIAILEGDFSAHQIIIASIHDEDMHVKYRKISITSGILESDTICKDFM